MGMTGAELALLFGDIGGKALGGALQPNPYQLRQTFKGTTADPIRNLTYAQDMLKSVITPQAAKVAAGRPLPGLDPVGLPSFTGGGMPMPIGVTTPDALKRRPLPPPGPTLPTGDKPPRDQIPDPIAPYPGPGGNTGYIPGTDNNPGEPPVRNKPRDGGDGSMMNANSALLPDPRIPEGLDPQTFGAIQLLMHSMQGGGT